MAGRSTIISKDRAEIQINIFLDLISMLCLVAVCRIFVSAQEDGGALLHACALLRVVVLLVVVVVEETLYTFRKK